jgi:hypothetical protein
MKTRIILLCSILCFLLISCKKQTPTVYYINDSFKKWTLFQKGSFWIFYNEQSNNIDSIYISETPTSWYSPAEPIAIQYILIKLSNSFLIQYLISSGPNDPVLSVEDIYSTDRNVFCYAQIVGSSIYASPTCKLVEKLDKYVINNNMFFNVIHTRDSNFVKPIITKDYYFVQNIGMVQYSIKTTSSDSTWSILRWHIVQ